MQLQITYVRVFVTNGTMQTVPFFAVTYTYNPAKVNDCI